MKVTIKTNFLKAGLWALACSLMSSAQAAEVSFPQTGAGKIAEKLVAAVNTREAGATDKFVLECITKEPWNQMTPEKYRSMLGKLREQSGDLRLERVFMADDQAVRLLVESPKNKKKVGLEIVIPSKESAQACWVWIHYLPLKGPAPLPRESLDGSGRMDAIQKYLDESASMGIHSGAVLLAKGDRVLLDKAWGYANATTKTPNQTDMQYGTASVGKMFTAVAIAQLHEAKKLEYTDTIEKFFPDYPNKEAARKIKISQLLAQTAGLGDPFDSPKLANRKNYQRQSDWFETFAEKPLAFEPGARHEYSNGGFIVLAAIVEEVSGMKFTDYVKKNIFDRAGMRQTGLTTASEKLGVSVPHAVTVVEDPLGLNGPQPKAAQKEAEDGVGMGGWTSTTQDLFKFARALRTNKLLKAANTIEITTGKVQFMPPPMDVKYCYGFYEMPIGQERMIGHSGGGGDLGMGAEVEMLWNSEYSIIVLSNLGVEEARRTAHDIARFFVYQEEHPATTTALKN